MKGVLTRQRYSRIQIDREDTKLRSKRSKTRRSARWKTGPSGHGYHKGRKQVSDFFFASSFAPSCLRGCSPVHAQEQRCVMVSTNVAIPSPDPRAEAQYAWCPRLTA